VPGCRIAQTVDPNNRGRLEKRTLIVRNVTPVQMGWAGAAQLGLVIREVTEKGKTTVRRHYMMTSRPASRLSAEQFLAARRQHWGIEGQCHQRLDVSLQEDQLRVRSSSAAATLGLLQRVSVALFVQAAPALRRKRDRTYPVWSGRQKRRPSALLRRLQKPVFSSG